MSSYRPAPERGEREGAETHSVKSGCPLSPPSRAGSFRSVPMAHAMGWHLSPWRADALPVLGFYVPHPARPKSGIAAVLVGSGFQPAAGLLPGVSQLACRLSRLFRASREGQPTPESPSSSQLSGTLPGPDPVPPSCAWPSRWSAPAPYPSPPLGSRCPWPVRLRQKVRARAHAPL